MMCGFCRFAALDARDFLMHPDLTGPVSGEVLSRHA
jgi:hypothetical protein